MTGKAVFVLIMALCGCAATLTPLLLRRFLYDPGTAESRNRATMWFICSVWLVILAITLAFIGNV